MRDLPSVRDLDVKGKRVLCRFDFNVPLKQGFIEDDRRLKESLPTIRYLKREGAKIIMMSHLGRPGGTKVQELSLAPAAKRLSELLDSEVKFVGEIVGDEIQKISEELKEGELLLLENTRFHPGEKGNDIGFSENLAKLGSVYVNDAFATAHRKHASTYGVATLIKEKAAGFLMLKEIENLSKLLKGPPPPFSIVLGGAKMKTKIPVIKNLAPLMDNLLVGGAMTYNFLNKKGIDVGDSLLEESLLPEIEEVFPILRDNNVNLYLPMDLVITDRIEERAKWKVIPVGDIPCGWKGVDIGPKTIQEFREIILESKTIFWNGPMGVFEISPFDKGTLEIATAMGEATKKGALTIVGGGDTDKVFTGSDIELSHLSTGGGAALLFLSGEELPAISILKEGVR